MALRARDPHDAPARIAPTFLLGHAIPHGVPWYFPVVFELKSTEGFLGLLILGGAAGIAGRKLAPAIPEKVRPHWRVLKIGLCVFLTVCLLSRLDISIRHFMLPEALLALMLAPVPRIVAQFPGRRVWQAAAGCSGSELPCHSGPRLSAFRLLRQHARLRPPGLRAHGRFQRELERGASGGRAVRRAAGLSEVPLDWFSLSDPALVAPRVRLWNCEQPAESDVDKLVVVRE